MYPPTLTCCIRFKQCSLSLFNHKKLIHKSATFLCTILCPIRTLNWLTELCFTSLLQAKLLNTASVYCPWTTQTAPGKTSVRQLTKTSQKVCRGSQTFARPAYQHAGTSQHTLLIRKTYGFFGSGSAQQYITVSRKTITPLHPKATIMIVTDKTCHDRIVQKIPCVQHRGLKKR